MMISVQIGFNKFVKIHTMMISVQIGFNKFVATWKPFINNLLRSCDGGHLGFQSHTIIIIFVQKHTRNNPISFQGPVWSYDSWINNYLWHQCLSALQLWVQNPLMVRCTRYNIMWWSLSLTCDRSVAFYGYFYFLHQETWLPRYNWNMVESGVKHHNTNPKPASFHMDLWFYRIVFAFGSSVILSYGDSHVEFSDPHKTT